MVSEEQEQPKNTQILQQGDATGPMEIREPSPNTATLSEEWRLRFKIGDQGMVIPIKGNTTVGRNSEGEAPDVDFDLTPFGAYHFGVSRRHAIISLNEGFLYLEDLHSTNGTRINGFQLTPRQKYRLRDGDEVEFARLRTIIKFELPGSH